LAWLPGARRTVFQQRCANFAAALAALLGGGTPLHAALGIAAESSGDPDLRRGAEALAVAVKDGRFPSDDGPIALRFPPFLRWAIWHSETSIGRGHALQIAARMYRESADRRAERLQTLAPVVTVVLVGGSVVLLYGLTLFVPVVEMLRALAAA
jgi:type II secretory pathway component PulF